MFECICVYTSWNHLAGHQKLTQHCKSTTLQLKTKNRKQGKICVPKEGGGKREEAPGECTWGLVQQSPGAASPLKVAFFLKMLHNTFSPGLPLLLSKTGRMKGARSKNGRPVPHKLRRQTEPVARAGSLLLCVFFWTKAHHECRRFCFLLLFVFHWQWISSPGVISLKLIREVIFNQLDAD